MTAVTPVHLLTPLDSRSFSRSRFLASGSSDLLIFLPYPTTDDARALRRHQDTLEPTFPHYFSLSDRLTA